MLDSVACPLCPDDVAKPIDSPPGVPLFRAGCGLVFQYPQPSMDELARLYSSAYFGGWGDEEAVRSMKRTFFRSILSSLSANVKSGRVLDVGCASGYFLEEAREQGWDGWGVEYSPFAAGIAREKFGTRIFEGTLEQAEFPDKSFELITMFDLLEHVTDPVIVLEEAGRILVNGGKILIVTPNVGSISARLMGHRWSHISREHLWYFDGKRLEQLLAETGFSVIACKPAVKLLSAKYISHQLSSYKHPILTPLSEFVTNIIPAAFRNKLLSLPCGQMIVLAGKERRL